MQPTPSAASELPIELVITLWVPVFSVILWSLFRLFAGRWIEDPPPQIGPIPELDEDLPLAVVRHVDELDEVDPPSRP